MGAPTPRARAFRGAAGGSWERARGRRRDETEPGVQGIFPGTALVQAAALRAIWRIRAAPESARSRPRAGASLCRAADPVAGGWFMARVPGRTRRCAHPASRTRPGVDSEDRPCPDDASATVQVATSCDRGDAHLRRGQAQALQSAVVREEGGGAEAPDENPGLAHDERRQPPRVLEGVPGRTGRSRGPACHPTTCQRVPWSGGCQREPARSGALISQLADESRKHRSQPRERNSTSRVGALDRATRRGQRAGARTAREDSEGAVRLNLCPAPRTNGCEETLGQNRRRPRSRDWSRA